MHNSGCTIYEDEWHTWIKLLLLHINNHFPEVIILGVWNVCWYGENVMLCFNAMSCNVPLEGLLSFSHRELRYKPVEKNQIQKWYQVRNMLKKVTEYEEEKITCVFGSYRNFYQFRIRNYKQIQC